MKITTVINTTLRQVSYFMYVSRMDFMYLNYTEFDEVNCTYDYRIIALLINITKSLLPQYLYKMFLRKTL